MTICTSLGCNFKWINGKLMNRNGKKGRNSAAVNQDRVLRNIFDPGGMKLQCAGGYCTLRRLMICTPFKMLFR